MSMPLTQSLTEYRRAFKADMLAGLPHSYLLAAANVLVEAERIAAMLHLYRISLPPLGSYTDVEALDV